MLRLDFTIHDVACFLHGKKCFPIITGLFWLEGKTSLHDGCMQKDVDGVGHGDTETGKTVSACALIVGSMRILIVAVLDMMHNLLLVIVTRK